MLEDYTKKELAEMSDSCLISTLDDVIQYRIAKQDIIEWIKNTPEKKQYYLVLSEIKRRLDLW